MSATETRDAMRAQLQSWAAAQIPAVEYVPTVNDPSEPAQDEWCAEEFTMNLREPYDYNQKGFIETNTMDVYIFTKAGKGDARNTELQGSLIDFMMGITNLNGNISVTEMVSYDDPGLASGGHYGVVISFTVMRYT